MTTELSVAILADIYRRKGIEGIGSFISKLLADERERGLKETLGSVNLKTMQEAMVEEGVAQERTRLVKIVEGMKNYRRPTHGECCTCQKCGGDIDDCDCKRNAIISDILSAHNARTMAAALLRSKKDV